MFLHALRNCIFRDGFINVTTPCNYKHNNDILFVKAIHMYIFFLLQNSDTNNMYMNYNVGKYTIE